VELQHLDIPPGSVLVQPDVQTALYEYMFDETIFPIPPNSYRSRVLKQIISRIEESITDPEQDVCKPQDQSFLFQPQFLTLIMTSMQNMQKTPIIPDLIHNPGIKRQSHGVLEHPTFPAKTLIS
jgi:hypothetical protein